MKKGFIVGLATGLTVAGASLVLANSQIQAILNEQIKVTLNGQVQEFKDETTNETQYPITYKDRTYLPLRTVANLVGVDVDYDVGSDTAKLNQEYQEICIKAIKEDMHNFYDKFEGLENIELNGISFYTENFHKVAQNNRSDMFYDESAVNASEFKQHFDKGEYLGEVEIIMQFKDKVPDNIGTITDDGIADLKINLEGNVALWKVRFYVTKNENSDKYEVRYYTDL